MSASAEETGFRAVAAPLVPVLSLGVAAIVADQLTQLVAGLPAFDPGYAGSRFQLSAMLPSRAGAMALGFLLLLGLGQWQGRARMVRVAVGGLVGCGVLLLLGLASLWFDGPVVKELIGAAELEAFVRSWIRLLAVTAFGVVLAAGLGLGAWRARRAGSSA